MKEIVVKKVRPMFNYIYTTSDKYESSQTIGNSGLVDIKKTEGNLKEYQTVVAVGNSVRDIKVGDMICINPTRYIRPVHNETSLKNGVVGDQVTTQYAFHMVAIDGKDYLKITDQDVDFIIDEYEEVNK